MKVSCKCYKVWLPENENMGWHARFECPNGAIFGFLFYPDAFKFVVGETYIFEVSDKYYEGISEAKVKQYY